MDTKKHLAIASVPVQEWNTVYDEEQAFKAGTIFPELNKPFYVTTMDCATPNEKLDLTSEETMLRQIQQTGFVLDDLRLFLDTHPESKEALNMFKQTLQRKTSLMKEFAQTFYPLTEVCMGVMEHQSWPEGRIPWEGVCS